MKVYQNIEEFTRLKCAVVTSGTFDGVHIGHQKILQQINKIARKIGGESVLITFWPHPRLVLDPADKSIKLLSTFEEKVKLLEASGLDHLVKIPFTTSFAKTSSEKFIESILVDAIGTTRLVIGYNHKFGHNREGSFDALNRDSSRYGFKVEEIPKQEVESIGVSSSKIRKSLSDGNIHVSNQLLGYEYHLTGTVVKGDQRGRTIGFPTANLSVNSPLKLIPADGSYAVRVNVAGKQYNGMLNIGMRPTVDGRTKTIEVNLFGFQDDIYGEDLTIDFIKMIRNESCFDSLDALRVQLIEDKQVAQQLLDNGK